MNSYHDGIPFKLPHVVGGVAWVCRIDTNQEGDPDDTQFAFDAEYIVTGRSLLLLELVIDKEYAEARAVAPNPVIDILEPIDPDRETI